MTEKCIATCTDGSECNAYPVSGEDKCRMHLGKTPDGSSHDGNQNAKGNSGGGAPEGNTNREDHGAFKELFRSSLTDDERAAVDDVIANLEDPRSAQEVARSVAADYLVKYQRSGDERFGRRFESICEKFNIAPTEEMTHNHQHAHKHDHDHELGEREHSALDSITGGPETIEVEAVDTTDTAQDDDGADDGDTLEIGW